MPIRKIERKKVDPRKIKSKNFVSCYIEVENVLSKGSLVASDPSREEFRLVSEVTIPSRQFKKSRHGKKLETDRTFSSTFMKDLARQIFLDLLSKSGLPPSKIDFLTVYATPFGDLKTPTETGNLFRELFNSCKTEFDENLPELEVGVSKIAANETKCEMIADGSKRIIKSKGQLSTVPQGFLDFSTYMSGLTNPQGDPTAVSGLITGLGLAIFDSLAQGHSEVNSKNGTVLQIPENSGRVYIKEAESLAGRAAELIKIQRVPSGTTRVGDIPVNVEESYKKNVKLVGCDVRDNGDKLGEITDLGKEASSYGTATLQRVIDRTFARFIGKIIKKLYEEGLIETDSIICISGRNHFSNRRLESAMKFLRKTGFEKISKRAVYIENPASFGN